MFSKGFKKLKKIRDQVTLPKSDLATPGTYDPLEVNIFRSNMKILMIVIVNQTIYS
jgi:hypothetical protein